MVLILGASVIFIKNLRHIYLLKIEKNTQELSFNTPLTSSLQLLCIYAPSKCSDYPANRAHSVETDVELTLNWRCFNDMCLLGGKQRSLNSFAMHL